MSLEELQRAVVEAETPEEAGLRQVLLESVLDADAEEQAVALMRDFYGEEGGKAVVVRALRTEGRAEWERGYVRENRPEFVALEPWEDVFWPPSTGDLQRARRIAWRETVSEEELKERVLTEGYDEGWAEEAARHKGGTRRARVSQTRDSAALEADDEAIEIWHYYERQTTKTGAMRVAYCVLHESVRDKAGLADLLPYEHGQYPFVEFTRERTARCLLDSRGVPELTATAQVEIKTQRDFRSDRASISVLPPVRVPANRGKVQLIFGPGSQVPERRPNEFGFMDPPRFDSGTIEMEKATLRDVDMYFGRPSAEVPAATAMLLQQVAVDRWLRGCKAAVAQAFALMQQYMSDVEVLRVTGTLPRPFRVTREEIQGRFDLTAEFDVRDLDEEHLGKKLDYIAKVIVPLDVAGVLDRAELVNIAVGAVDPVIASRIVRSAEAATAAEADEEQTAVAKISAGVEPPLPEQGVNAGLRLQVLQRSLQANPALQARYGQDEIFRAMIDARAQALQFQLQQVQNAQIGRVGAVPALGAQAQTDGGAFAAPGGMAA